MLVKMDIDKYSQTYEALTDDERGLVEEKLFNIINGMRAQGIDEGEIYNLKCRVASDMFGKKLLMD